METALYISIVAALVWVGGKLESKFAASQLWLALEAERDRCVAAVTGELLTGDRQAMGAEDIAYNAAIEDCLGAIRKLLPDK